MLLTAAAAWGADQGDIPSNPLVLMYHDVITSKQHQDTSDIRAADLEAQLRILKINGYESRTAAQVVECKARPGCKLPEKTVVLTFDDGYLGVFNQARPLLRKYGFNASIYVHTSYVGKGGSEHGHGSRKKKMTWGQLSELESDGMEIGAHTRNHPDLETIQQILQSTTPVPMNPKGSPSDGRLSAVLQDMLQKGLSPKDPFYVAIKSRLESGRKIEKPAEAFQRILDFEIRGSFEDLKTNLPRAGSEPIRTLAYPYGSYTVEAAKTAQKTGFRAAFVVGAGKSLSGAPAQFQIPRLSITDPENGLPSEDTTRPSGFLAQLRRQAGVILRAQADGPWDVLNSPEAAWPCLDILAKLVGSDRMPLATGALECQGSKLQPLEKFYVFSEPKERLLCFFVGGTQAAFVTPRGQNPQASSIGLWGLGGRSGAGRPCQIPNPLNLHLGWKGQAIEHAGSHGEVPETYPDLSPKSLPRCNLALSRRIRTEIQALQRTSVQKLKKAPAFPAMAEMLRNSCSFVPGFEGMSDALGIPARPPGNPPAGPARSGAQSAH